MPEKEPLLHNPLQNPQQSSKSSSQPCLTPFFSFLKNVVRAWDLKESGIFTVTTPQKK
jgi:hypothetical protein